MSAKFKGEMPPQGHESSEKPKEKIWIITLEQFQQLPDGTELISTFGERIIKGRHEVDPKLEKFGYLPVGFSEHTKPAGIQFDEGATRWVEVG